MGQWSLNGVEGVRLYTFYEAPTEPVLVCTTTADVAGQTGLRGRLSSYLVPWFPLARPPVWATRWPLKAHKSSVLASDQLKGLKVLTFELLSWVIRLYQNEIKSSLIWNVVDRLHQILLSWFVQNHHQIVVYLPLKAGPFFASLYSSFPIWPWLYDSKAVKSQICLIDDRRRNSSPTHHCRHEQPSYSGHRDPSCQFGLSSNF